MKKTLLILILSIISFQFSIAQNGTVVDGVVAVVGKSIIKMSDVENSYVQYRLRQGAENAQETRCMLLENMMLSKLLLHKGEVDSVEVTDEQVEQEVQYYLKNHHSSLDNIVQPQVQ